MDTLEQIQRQENIEMQYNRKHIDDRIRGEIEANPIMQDKIEQGIQLITEYMGKTYYDSKNARIAQLHGLDLRALVLEIFVGVAYCQIEELFTSVTAMMAGRLRFSDKLDAIKTIAELMAVLCLTDAFDILKASKSASLVVVSRIPLGADTLRFIENSQFLPPMVCRPMELENNYSSGYLTHNDSLVLGTGNHHDGDLCLDVLNKINQIPLALDTTFLSSIEEDPTFIADTPEKREQWDKFKRQSYEFYLLIAQYGNRFHLTWKVDKRGRIYSQGFHINVQGTPFKKAMIELAKQEVVIGVPI
jgi:hypothetical protein